MKSTRDAFGEELLVLAKNDEKIMVLTADLATATRVDKIAEDLPDQFLDVGIAECNMIGIAAGLATRDYTVFATSFASFLTGKYDVIRVSVGYNEAPVILVGTHAGLAVGKDGVTQMGLEDVALMRAIPEMEIFSPSTPIQTKHIVRNLTRRVRTTYLRLGRQPVKEFYEDKDSLADDHHVIGPIILHDDTTRGPTVTIISSGCMLETAHIVREKLMLNDGIKPRLIDCPCLKSSRLNLNINGLSKESPSDLIVTMEDHSIIGGLGSMICEHVASCGLKSKVLRIGVPDTWASSGKPEDLYEVMGMSPTIIQDHIRLCLEP